MGISPCEATVNKGGIGSHTKPNQGETNTWLTPEFIIEALGPFDLDPCAAPSPRPWHTAHQYIELPADGLELPWDAVECRSCGFLNPDQRNEFDTRCSPGDPCPSCGESTAPHRAKMRVWMNPPYGRETDAWLEKLSKHRLGTALIFARTETATWTRWVWPHADSILFLEGRLWFHKPDGKRGDSNAGGPSALIAYSHAETCHLLDALDLGLLKGQLVTEWKRGRNGN